MNTKKRPYHHGDLRQALIDAALLILQEEGLAKVSLRSIARTAGVSQTAPYSHFTDKNALLVEVAACGFKMFGQALNSVSPKDNSPAALRAHLDALGVIYVQFALQNKAHFRLMFGEALSDIPKSDAYRREGEKAYGYISQAVAACTNDPDAPLAAWSLVHGLATLMVDRKMRVEDDLAAQVGSVTRFLNLSDD